MADFHLHMRIEDVKHLCQIWSDNSMTTPFCVTAQQPSQSDDDVPQTCLPSVISERLVSLTLSGFCFCQVVHL